MASQSSSENTIGPHQAEGGGATGFCPVPCLSSLAASELPRGPSDTPPSCSSWCGGCGAESGVVSAAPGVADQLAAGRGVAVAAAPGSGVDAAEVDHVAAAAAGVPGVAPIKPLNIDPLSRLEWL